jgi:hypothetical protein
MHSSNDESMVNFKPNIKVKKVPAKAYKILVGDKKDFVTKKELQKVNSDTKLLSPRVKSMIHLIIRS